MVDMDKLSPQMNEEDQHANPEMDKPKSLMTFEEFMEAQHVMGAVRHRKMAHGGALADETRGQGRVLALLKMADGVATRDMAQVLGIRVSSLNETLAKMEQNGLIERIPSEDDKRVMLVYLTDSGREQAEGQPQSKLPDRMFDGFADEELDQFASYLERLIDNLIDELGEGSREELAAMRKARDEMMRAFEHGGRCHGRGRGRGHGCEGRRPENDGHGGHGDAPRCGHGHGSGRGGFGGGFDGPHGHGPRRHEHRCEHD